MKQGTEAAAERAGGSMRGFVPLCSVIVWNVASVKGVGIEGLHNALCYLDADSLLPLDG
jgi:hypothetical protein